MIVSFAALAAVASTAFTTVSIGRAELSGTRLRIEGRAIANRTITVNGAAMGTSESACNFRIERDPFSAPADCTVDGSDGSASPTPARLSGCTVSPAATTAGTFGFTLRLTDATGATVSRTFNVTVG